MLRITFTSADIARTRVSPRADPLWDLALSIHMLRGQPGDALFGAWRRATIETLRRTRARQAILSLMSLVPTYGYFPDFLTPAAAMRGLDHGLEAVRSTPKRTVVDDLSRVVVGPGRAPDVRALALGGATTMTELVRTMRSYYDIAIAPHQAQIDSAVVHDRAARTRAMADGGVDGLLGSLGAWATWSAGELRVPAHPEQEIHLDGRGLLLVPSYFCVNHPMTLFDERLEPVLIYPAARATGPLIGGAARRVGHLIGHTRAAVLREIATGGSTLDIARRVGISPASASEHAAVLRAAGLVASRRDRNRMMHQATGLGLSLLNGG